MSKHPLKTKVKIPSAKVAKAFMQKELDAFEKSHPKPDRASYIKSEKAYGADPILYPNDCAEYETALEQFWQAWAVHQQTPEFQDRMPKSANRLVQEKFVAWAEEKGIELYSEVFWSLWDVMKEQDGFQVTVGKGGGNKNTESETRVIDMYRMTCVADVMHKKKITRSKAAEQFRISKYIISKIVKRRGEDIMQLFENDRAINTKNKKLFTEMMDRIDEQKRQKKFGVSKHENIRLKQAELKRLDDEIVVLPGDVWTTKDDLWFEKHKAEQEALKQKLKKK